MIMKLAIIEFHLTCKLDMQIQISVIIGSLYSAGLNSSIYSEEKINE